jgi:hypothetical protein
MKRIKQAAEGEGVGLERSTVGLEEPAIRLSFQAKDEMNNCHFEPKARNLEFHFSPVLKTSACALRGLGCRNCQSHSSRGSLQSKLILFAPYPFLSPY